MTKESKLKKIVKKAVENGYVHVSVNEDYRLILFDKSFAKAIWGEDRPNLEITMWEYHLPKAVMADDPISYYMEHLDG